MATEYKLSYTGAEINEKLGKVSQLETAIDDDIEFLHKKHESNQNNLANVSDDVREISEQASLNENKINWLYEALIAARLIDVAQVGDVKYKSIDEAITAWTHNTTLTLLCNVTLSDTIQLNSTETHTLDLGMYTMTAAPDKNAIEIIACGAGSTEKYALIINADENNPGGIDAGNKSVVYYSYKKGGITSDDRPILRINGGVFTGSTSTFGSAGIYSVGSAARKCMTLQVEGGVFNCSVVGTTKGKYIISGGTFNDKIMCSNDSTANTLISGGTFKDLTTFSADSNNNRFWIGTGFGNPNVGVYIDNNGYMVIGGDVITEPGTQFKAFSTVYSSYSSYLKYSSVDENGLYFTSVIEALNKYNKTSGNVTVYATSLDLTELNYKGTINLPETTTKFTVTFNKGTYPAWTVTTSAEGKEVTYEDVVSGWSVTRTYTIS